LTMRSTTKWRARSVSGSAVRPQIKMVSDLGGGQGDAETRPERRLRGRDRRRDARCVPFLLLLSELGTKAVNLGGVGGQSPLAAPSGVCVGTVCGS
jgi:hypothetical protein